MSSQQQPEVSTGLTDQALLIHCSAKNFLIVFYVLSITVFCITIYIYIYIYIYIEREREREQDGS
jgi:hypothetical protein